tara:strand:- start:675 stop:2105 length:1431 start_codon:yes stop_codon:yes gene_type:complete
MLPFFNPESRRATDLPFAMSDRLEIDDKSARALCWLMAIKSDGGDRAIRRALKDLEDDDGHTPPEPIVRFTELGRQFPDLLENDRQLDVGLPRAMWIAPMTIALILGLAADSLTSGGKIHLLSLPVVALLAWNFAVFAWIIGAKLLKRGQPQQTPENLVGQWVARKYEALRGVLDRSHAGADWSGIRERFIARWLDLNRGRFGNLLALILHGSAIAMVLGIVIGMYVRGLGFEYRAGWSSTFWNAESMYQFLVVLLGPASALTTIPIPGPEELKGLSWSVNPKGVNAAPWIHLYAETCFSFVIIPRAYLAWRAWKKTRYVVFDLPASSNEGPQVADARHVCVIPFNVDLNDERREGIRAAVSGASGQAQLEFREKVEYDAVGRYFSEFKLGTHPDVMLLVFSLGTTPEQEIQGDVIERCQAAARPHLAAVELLLETTSFQQRFGEDRERYDARVQNWCRFAEEYELTVLLTGGGDE